MSQENPVVSQVRRRDLRRALTVTAVVAAMGAVAAFQLRQEAARLSAAAPSSALERTAPTR